MWRPRVQQQQTRLGFEHSLILGFRLSIVFARKQRSIITIIIITIIIVTIRDAGTGRMVD
jgi:hypothetical protein